MTTDVEQLPDAPWLGHDPERGDLHGFSHDEVRAIVAHATAAKDAKITHERWLRDQAENRCVAVEDQREALRSERDFLVEEYERAVGCGPQGYTHAAMHLFNAITNAQADQNAKDAEIEALRVDVEAWNASHSLLTDTCHHFQARAKRLAEALREVQPFIGWVGSYEELHAKIDALLRDLEEGK